MGPAEECRLRDRLMNGASSHALDGEDAGEGAGVMDEAEELPTGMYPYVRFDNGGERLCTPEEWSIEQGGKVTAQRVQVPLRLAWAISIHKSQGMTLESVELQLATCFEPGQAYVALSRVVSLEATRLLSFDHTKVRAHPDVLAFYKQLDERDGCIRAPGDGAAANSTVAVGGSGGGNACGGSLSEEQRARMAANKAAALARAAEKKALREQTAMMGVPGATV